jgi:hypothetical protein
MIVACGQSGRDVKLEVSSSFIYSSSSVGGLIIQGTRAEGGKFIVSAASGSSINVSLLDGNWTFLAVGWDSNTDTFGGNVSCGKSTTKLTAEVTSISLKISPSNCNNSEFTNGLSAHENSTVGLKRLSIYSCSNLLNSAGGVFNSASNTLSGFCGSGPTEQRNQPQSVRIALDNVFPAGFVSQGLNRCFNLPGSSSNLVNLARLPIHSFPFRVTLFQDKDCSGTTVGFHFSTGIANGRPLEFDSAVNNLVSTSENILLLPFNYGRRGRSPTLKLPDVHCGSVSIPQSCVPDPMLPSITISGSTITPDFVFDRYGSTIMIAKNSTATCDSSGNTNYTPPTSSDVIFNDCRCRPSLLGGADIFCKAKLNSSSSACASAPTSPCSSISITLDSVTKYFLPIANGTFYVYNDLLELIPGSISSGKLRDSLDTYIWKNPSFGPISEAREFLGFRGELTAFSSPLNETNISCSNLTGSKTIMGMSGFGLRTFNLIAKESPAKIPAVFCGTLDAQCPATSGGVGSTYFNKRVILRELQNLQWITRQVIDFNCSTKVGQLQIVQSDQFSGQTYNEKNLVIWNTEDIDNSLVEHYLVEEHLTSSQENKKRILTRIHRGKNATGGTLVKAEKLQNQFSSFNEPVGGTITNFKSQQLEQSEYVINEANAKDVIFESINITGTIPGALNQTLYTLPFADAFKKWPLTISPYKATSGPFTGLKNFDYDELTSTTNNNFKVMVWREGSDLKIKFAKNGAWQEKKITPATGYEYFLPKVSLNNNGKFVLSYIKTDGATTPTTYLYIQRYSPGSGGLNPETPVNFSSQIIAHDVKMFDGDEVIVVYGTTQKVHYREVTDVSTVFTLGTVNDIDSHDDNGQVISPDSLKLAIHNSNKLLLTWALSIKPGIANVTSGASVGQGTILKDGTKYIKCNISTGCTLSTIISGGTNFYDPSVWGTIHPNKEILSKLYTIEYSPLDLTASTTIVRFNLPASSSNAIDLELVSRLNGTFLSFATDVSNGQKYFYQMVNTSSSFASLFSGVSLPVYQNAQSACADSSTFGVTGGCSDRSRPQPTPFSKGLNPTLESLKHETIDSIFSPLSTFQAIN